MLPYFLMMVKKKIYYQNRVRYMVQFFKDRGMKEMGKKKTFRRLQSNEKKKQEHIECFSTLAERLYHRKKKRHINKNYLFFRVCLSVHVKCLLLTKQLKSACFPLCIIYTTYYRH